MTEFSVAIVDDDYAFAGELIHQIKEWASRNDCRISFDYMKSAFEFIEKLDELSKWSALFLDVEMPELNGIDLARRIRYTNTDIPIAFISAFPLFSTDGYEVTACRFIVKNRPEFKTKLNECMQYVLSQILESGPTTFYIQTPNLVTSVLYRDILFFEAQLHNIVVRTATDRFQYRKNISVLAHELPKYFVQTSRSYIVNMKHVKSLHTDSVELDNGQFIQLTKTYKVEVMKSFMRR